MKQIFEPYTQTIKQFCKNNLIIRPSKDIDYEDLVYIKLTIFKELSPRLLYWYSKNPPALKLEFFGLEKQDPKRRVFYTIETLEKKIVGSGGLLQHDPENNPDIGEISDIYLLKEYRGIGLGETLVKDLIKKAEEINFESVYLSTRVEFDAAIKLYKKLGFQKAKKQKYPKSKNSISLELELK